jgi:hypothetical protein
MYRLAASPCLQNAQEAAVTTVSNSTPPKQSAVSCKASLNRRVT